MSDVRALSMQGQQALLDVASELWDQGRTSKAEWRRNLATRIRNVVRDASRDMKVVPADAIVLEPLDFGDEPALSIAANALGYAPRTAAEVARLHEHVTYLASALARLQKHPPADEGAVGQVAHLIAGNGRMTDEHIAAARRVVQGWTKPEPTP